MCARARRLAVGDWLLAAKRSGIRRQASEGSKIGRGLGLILGLFSRLSRWSNRLPRRRKSDGEPSAFSEQQSDKADSRRLTAEPFANGKWPIANRQWLTARFLLASLTLVTLASFSVASSSPALCAGNCQGCYCDQIINGTCHVNGRPSGCIGCVGSCVGDDNCQCRAGVGGCGRVIAWCRSSDCQPRPTPVPTPTPVLTPTPVPPICSEGIFDTVTAPDVADWFYEPDYPTVVGQDPTFRGFDLVVQATGGYAERQQVLLEQLCPDGSPGPAACPATWRWQCSTKVLARYDDPIVAIDLPMRLADSSVDWLQDDLRPRYPGASHKEGLPRTFILWRGASMSVSTGLFDYKAQDPGVHGGKIVVTTRGTPLNDPQRIAVPFAVPVYLRDSTLSR